MYALTFLDSVVVSDGEVFLCEIWNHDYGRAVAESLLDNGTGERHILKDLIGEWLVTIAVTSSEILLTYSIQEIWTIGHYLEHPSARAAGSVLRSEEEGENGLGDLKVGEHANQHVWLIGLIDFDSIGNLLAVLLGYKHGLDPAIHNTIWLSTGGHSDLAFGGALGKLIQNHIGSLLAVP